MFEATVLLGDCLTHLEEMPSEQFQLIYLDPPFYTQRSHALQTRDRSQTFTFEDSWPTLEAYIVYIRARLKQLHRVLSQKGSIYFHCDRNAAHVVRMALDDVFGSDKFRAEIIWSYRRWSNAARGLLPSHQNILYYTKSDDFVFNQVFDEYSPSTNVDQILQRRGRDASNKSIYLRGDDGKIVPHTDKRGVPLSDVWDIPFLNPKAKERTGYPTQKPLLLLERIIGLSSNVGDQVLDPFCGSGTTLVAAASMRRFATGIDVSEAAVELSKGRLGSPVRTSSRLHEYGRDSYREADPVLLQQLRGVDHIPVHRNAGIDAILKQDFAGSPVTVRIQRSGENLSHAAELLYRASITKGSRVMFLVAGERGGAFAFAGRLPPGVKCIESPALQIREHLAVLEESGSRSKHELPGGSTPPKEPAESLF